MMYRMIVRKTGSIIEEFVFFSLIEALEWVGVASMVKEVEEITIIKEP